MTVFVDKFITLHTVDTGTEFTQNVGCIDSFSDHYTKGGRLYISGADGYIHITETREEILALIREV